MEKVIYLSFAQGTNIDGPKLAQSVSAVMVRAGQGIWEDPLFRYNYQLCIDNKIPFGIWWFCQPNMPANYQVNAFMTVWNSLPVKPVVIAYDVEEIDYRDDNGIMQKLFPPTRQFNHDNVLAWCKQIKAATGAKVGIYTRKNYFESWTFETDEWYQFWMWIAAWYLYTGEVPPALPWNWHEYKLHQYQGGGQGTPGVDPAQTCKEYFNGTHAECLNFFGAKQEQTMAGIHDVNVPMAQRAWVMEIKTNQKVNVGYQSLGVDAIILPMVGMPWDGNHQTVIAEPTFAGRFAEVNAAGVSVIGKVIIDASIVTTEQHSQPELDGHNVWQNLVVPKILDAWHIGPWSQSTLKPSDFRPIKAIIFEMTSGMDHQNPPREIVQFWQTHFFRYVVDKFRVLVQAGAVPNVPLILKSTPAWLQKYSVETGCAEWLYLALSEPKLESTAIMPDLWSIFKYAPGDEYRYSYVPDGYQKRVLLYEFTAGKQRMSFATGTAYLSKAFTDASRLATFLGESVVIPPVEPPLEKTIEERLTALETEARARGWKI